MGASGQDRGVRGFDRCLGCAEDAEVGRDGIQLLVDVVQVGILATFMERRACRSSQVTGTVQCFERDGGRFCSLGLGEQDVKQ